MMRQALIDYRQTGNSLYRVWFLVMLAEAYRQHRNPHAGLDIVTEAMAVQSLSGPFFGPELNRLKGELLLMQSRDNEVEAETCFDHALRLARRQAAKSWELRAATSLARLWRQQERLEQARQLLTEVYTWFSEGFETNDLQEARTLLHTLG